MERVTPLVAEGAKQALSSLKTSSPNNLIVVTQAEDLLQKGSSGLTQQAAASIALHLMFRFAAGTAIDAPEAKKIGIDVITRGLAGAASSVTKAVLNSAEAASTASMLVGTGIGVVRECPTSANPTSCTLTKFRQGMTSAVASYAASRACSPVFGPGASLCSAAAGFFVRMHFSLKSKRIADAEMEKRARQQEHRAEAYGGDGRVHVKGNGAVQLQPERVPVHLDRLADIDYGTE